MKINFTDWFIGIIWIFISILFTLSLKSDAIIIWIATTVIWTYIFQVSIRNKKQEDTPNTPKGHKGA